MRFDAAYAWLKAELADWTSELSTRNAWPYQFVAVRYEPWQLKTERDLAPLRKLTDPKWVQLWQDVDEMLEMLP